MFVRQMRVWRPIHQLLESSRHDPATVCSPIRLVTERLRVRLIGLSGTSLLKGISLLRFTLLAARPAAIPGFEVAVLIDAEKNMLR